MQTRVSTKGQIVLPGPLRRRLGISAGDPLDIAVEGSRIVLTMKAPSKRSAKIIKHPRTGLPVISFGCGESRVLTSQQVEDILSTFA